MANNTTPEMDSLKKEAVRVYTGMISVWPLFSKEEPLKLSGMIPKFNGCYAMNNSTVCFISDNEIFVTPYTRLAIRTLHSAGFCKESFPVPFSNGEYPKSEKTKWDSLCTKARLARSEDFAQDCVSYCDDHNIGTIRGETLQNCFEMPIAGVKVNWHNVEQCLYPIISFLCLDYHAAEYIGHFCTNNGKVVFVYRNGKTYVTKGYKILDELREAGYVESSLFVPFSNGERILDDNLRERWESITK